MSRITKLISLHIVVVMSTGACAFATRPGTTTQGGCRYIQSAHAIIPPSRIMVCPVSCAETSDGDRTAEEASLPESWSVYLSISARDGSRLTGRYHVALTNDGSATINGGSGHSYEKLFDGRLKDMRAEAIFRAAGAVVDGFGSKQVHGQDGYRVRLTVATPKRTWKIDARGMSELSDLGDDFVKLLREIRLSVPRAARPPWGGDSFWSFDRPGSKGCPTDE